MCRSRFSFRNHGAAYRSHPVYRLRSDPTTSLHQWSFKPPLPQRRYQTRMRRSRPTWPKPSSTTRRRRCSTASRPSGRIAPIGSIPCNCAALHVTQIRLRDDETTDKDNVKVGDRDRWGTIVGDHSVLIFPLGSTVSITVPSAQVTIPRDPHMVTNLAIHTTLHLPNGELTAGNDYMFDPVKEVKASKSFTEKVEFYYPDYVRAQDAARKQQEAPR